MMRIYHLQQYWNQSVIAFIKPFRASESDDSDENYYMEREWRVSGDVHFGLSDVYRVIIPESFARRFREDFPNFFGQLSFVE